MSNKLHAFRATCVAMAALAIGAIAPATADEPVGHVKGAEDAPLTLVEFASVTCSHCKHFNDDMMPVLKEEFIDTGKVQLEFRPYALNSIDVAIYTISECAGEETFFPIVDEVFNNQQQLIQDAQDGKAYEYLVELAGRHGLDNEDAMNACLADPEMRKRLVDSMATGDAAGVTGTPSFLINGKLKRLDSDFKSPEALRAYLNKALAETAVESTGE